MVLSSTTGGQLPTAVRRGLSLSGLAIVLLSALAIVLPAAGSAAVLAGTATRSPYAEPSGRAAPAPLAGSIHRAGWAARTGSRAGLLQFGAQGPAVRAVQRALARLSYLPRTGVDGRFGVQTWHAVIAFQGWNGLARDGIVGPDTSRTLRRAGRPRPWSTAPGIEIHLKQQVLLLISAGRVQRAIHVSTGAGATTPLGHYTILRRDRMSWSLQFHVWMPLAQYFHAGYALHESASVPAYPASHGCVRIPPAYALEVWRFGMTGMRVWTRA